ncbi:centrosomal protein of 164 kDa-like isoform X3 [Stegostoma tigrinum]|uniref:centrosomal protein of 164 kDa-like isoform X3 n=1 Tax=Stegostoma tigrinum TaxID=3053191 RepID=UPI002870543D|nr:centrosomal protein of 164 kDa-like isoform X3 [Stegostoma tigrinum]
MTATALRIGDQLILEEDYDENYIPNEQEIQEYAREIGIDPENEPELMWLAREGIVAPLPQEWKPCQDVTGDVYYFNFVSGQSTWDHPCDEQYRNLVSLEREKLLALSGSKKKEKKKKEKKEKKEKEQLKSATILGLQPSLVQAPQGGLAPLRGLGEFPASTLYGSLSNISGTTGGRMKSTLASSATFRIPKTGGLTTSLLGVKPEEKISMNLADFSEDDDDMSGEKSAPDTAQLMKNLHIDVGTLGDGFEYEESAEIDEDADHDHVDEGTEPELQNLPGSDEEAGSQKEVSFEQSQERSLPGSVLDSESRDVQPPTPNKLIPDKEADDDIDTVDEKLSIQDKSGSDTENDIILMQAEEPGVQECAMAIDREENNEIGAGDSRCDSVGNSSKLPPVDDEDIKSEHKTGGDPKLSCVTKDEEIKADNERKDGDKKDSMMPKSNHHEPHKESESSQQLEDMQVSEAFDESDTNFELDGPGEWNGGEMGCPLSPSTAEEVMTHTMTMRSEVSTQDLGIQIQAVERILDVETLSPALDLQLTPEREDGDGKKQNVEDFERRKRSEVAERSSQDRQKEEDEQKDKELLHTQRSVELLRGKLSEELAQEERRILHERKEQLCKLRIKLRQEEEEETQQIYRDKENKIRLLKEQLRIEQEEEEARLKQEQSNSLLKLQTQIKNEVEATEKEIRVENEAILQQLRDELRSQQATEQQNLEAKKCAVLEQMKKETDEIVNKEKIVLEEKKEKAVNELRVQLEKEMKEELEELKNKHNSDLQGLKTTTEEKHQELLSNLRKQMADAHNNEEAQLQRDIQKAQKNVQQIADFERELSDLLQDKQVEVEKDHEWKIEQIKQEHEQTMERIREEYEEEERQQRARLLKQLQEEHERLAQLHERELLELRQEMEQRLDELRKLNREKELKVQEAEEQLELRIKDLKAKSSLLQNQEMSLKLKRQQLHAEEEQLEKDQTEILSRPSKQEVEQSKREHSTLQDSIRKARLNLNKLQDQQVDLHLEVDALQKESQKLQNKLSELEVTIRKKQRMLKEVPVINETSGDAEEGELHIEDLNLHIKSDSNCGRSPVPRTEDEEVSMDNVRYYISAEELSINKAKEFLMRQTRSLRKRQTALKSAKQQWRHDVRKAQENVQDPESSQILQDVYKNLEQEAQHLDEMKLTMRQGQLLLQKKEEKLNQLESSLAEGISDEDAPKNTGDKKAVTFDLTDSDDISSIASINSPQQKTDLKTELSLAQRANIQYLSDSVQKITNDLNSVLCVLGSLGMQQSPLFSTAQTVIVPPPSNSVPLSVYTSLSRTQNSGPLLSSNTVPLPSQWIWNRGTSTTTHLPTSQSVDDALSEKWHKYFPGGMPTLRSSAPLESRFGYVSASDQVKMLHQSHSKITQGDRNSIQGMIDANRKWLESFKKDPKVPLFTKTSRTPSTQGLIQLGLDENNQIKVYHF